MVTLLPRKGKDFAQLLFLGDFHLGHPQCRVDKIKDQIDFAIKNQVYVILMGDLIECGTTTSIGDSVYQQTLNPQEQMEYCVELLEPLAKRKLIIGLHEGNHEKRITNNTSINVGKVMSKLLRVKYLGYSCWSELKVGKIKYSLYSTHGCGGSRFKHTKLKTVIDLTHFIHADCIAMGHTHSIACETTIQQAVVKSQVKEISCQVFLTGSYISWDRSYAQMKNMPITKLGSPKARFSADRKKIHAVL